MQNRARHAALLALCVVLLPCAAVRAETLYVSTDLRAGLHQDKSLDSAIVKLLPAGTALEVIKKEDPLALVREPGGATGWVDNSYLSTVPGGNPDSARLQERADTLERRLTDANKQIADLEMQLTQNAPNDAARQYQVMRKQATELDRQLRDERLKSGELQTEISELKKRLGQNNSTTVLQTRVEELEADNKRLQSALAADGGAAARSDVQPSVSGAADPGAVLPADRQLLLGISGMILLSGFAIGVFLMDWLNRRRHGGFRV